MEIVTLIVVVLLGVLVAVFLFRKQTGSSGR